jgi:Ni,Fe-hydrogenase III large subunit
MTSASEGIRNRTVVESGAVSLRDLYLGYAAAGYRLALVAAHHDVELEARVGGTGHQHVEGWRGTIAQRVELDGEGTLTRAKIVDPSFFNWPALPVALADTIVPNFPLTNMSFNVSYAGNDL